MLGKTIPVLEFQFMKTPQDLSFLAKTLIQYGLVLGSIGLGGFLAGDFLLTNWANLATTSGAWVALGGGVVTSITSAVVVWFALPAVISGWLLTMADFNLRKTGHLACAVAITYGFSGDLVRAIFGSIDDPILIGNGDPWMFGLPGAGILALIGVACWVWAGLGNGVE